MGSVVSMKQNIWIQPGNSIHIFCFMGRKDFSSVFSQWRKLFEYNLVISFKNLIHSTEGFQFSLVPIKQNIWMQSDHSIQIFCIIGTKRNWNLSVEWRKLLEYNLLVSFKNLIHSTERFQFSLVPIKQNIWIEWSDCIQIFSSSERKIFRWTLFFEWSKTDEYNLVILLNYFLVLKEQFSVEVFSANQARYLNRMFKPGM